MTLPGSVLPGTSNNFADMEVKEDMDILDANGNKIYTLTTDGQIM